MSDINWPAGIVPILMDDASAVAARLASDVAGRLRDALLRRDRVSLAVSGGSTPKVFFEMLSRATLEWTRVDVTLVDERWVGADDPASNERLVRQHLIQNAAASANFISLKQPGNFGGSGQVACESALSGLAWPLDVVVLGMGNDGHTASLFPDAPELSEALDPGNPAKSIALTPPSQPQHRVSLTFSVLSAAGFTALHLRGNDKMETLKKAVTNLDDERAMPVRAFLGRSVSVFWSP